MRKSRWVSTVLAILLFVSEGLALAQPAPAVPPAANAVPAAPPAPISLQTVTLPSSTVQTVPTRIVAEDWNTWTFGGGFVYWVRGDTGLEILKRRPEQVNFPDTLKNGGTSAYEFDYMVADDSGLYYAYGFGQADLEARYTYAPSTAQVLTSVSNPTTTLLVLDDDYVYYDMYIPFAGGIYRRAKSGPGGGERISDAEGLTALAVGATHIYWADAEGLWRSDKTCTNPACWDQKELLLDLDPLYGDIIARLGWIDADNLLVVQEDDVGYYIHRCPATTICYNGIIHSALRSEVRALNAAAVRDNYLFWTEARVGNTLGLLRRKNLDAPWETDTLYENDYLDLDMPIYAGKWNVIFGMRAGPNPGIYTLVLTAPPLEKDLGLLAMEVTQGIQNLDPATQVPLVADKETIVRVYGTISGTYGNGAEVILRATHSGGLPPGPPLMPLRMSNVYVGQTLDNLHRSDKDVGWQFRLPPEWVKAGTLTLEAEIDPRGVYEDPDRANNIISQQVVLQPTKPVCISWIPVHTPPGTQRTNSAIFWPMMALAKRMWPTAEMKAYQQSESVEELELCWYGIFPYPCFGLYRRTHPNGRTPSSAMSR